MKYFLLFLLFLSTSAFANVGKITAYKGEASIIRDSNTLTPSIGFVIEKNDQITTQDKSRLQIVFEDKTIISLGAKTSFSIQEYFYDELQPKKVTADFKFAKGIFKTITGKIALINPNKFKLKTKTASIGIRGTVFFGEIKEDGSEDISCTFGAIAVETAQGIVEVQAGQATSFALGQMPTPPKKMTALQKAKVEKSSGASDNEKESGQDESSVPLDTLHETIAAIADETTVEDTTTQTVVDDLSDVNDDAKEEVAENITHSTGLLSGFHGMTLANLYSGSGYYHTTNSFVSNYYDDDYDYDNYDYNLFTKRIVDLNKNVYLDLYGTDYSTIIPMATTVDNDEYTYTSLANGDKQETPNSEIFNTATDGTKVTYSGGYIENSTDPYLMWGKWSKTNGDIKYTYYYDDDYYDDSYYENLSIDNSVWIAGELTPPSEVPTIGSADYSGTLEGFNANDGREVAGTIGIGVNFAANTVTSNLVVNYLDGTIFGSDSDIYGSLHRTNDDVEVYSGSSNSYIYGAFYGSNAKAIGGIWSLTNYNDTDNSYETANGSFATSEIPVVVTEPVVDTPVVDDDVVVDDTPTSSITTTELYGTSFANVYNGTEHISQNSGLFSSDDDAIFTDKIIDIEKNAYFDLHGSTYTATVPIAGVVDDAEYTYKNLATGEIQTTLASGNYQETPISEVSTTSTDGTTVTYSGSYGTYTLGDDDLDSYLSWGTWSNTNGDIDYTIDGDTQNVSIDNSVWIAGQLTTPSEVPTTGSANYSGTLEGFHTAGSAVNGTIGINVDFAADTVTSNLNVNYVGGGTFGSASDLSGSITRFDESVEFKASGSTATIGGAFYGSDAKAAGGVWTMTNDNYETANGSFAASKQ